MVDSGRPKLLDLFCCAGGAAMGYYKAGFEVIGCDIKDQPNYPFKFIRGDWKYVLNEYKDWADCFHASPPCQGYSKHTKENSVYVNHSKGKDEPRLISIVRESLPKDKYYIIENVVGAKDELINPILLCGTMFDLPFARHRLFESNLLIMPPDHPKCNGVAKKHAQAHGIDYRDMSMTGKSRRKGSIETWKQLIGMDWAGRAWEISEAIPPAYTYFLGRQFINAIEK